MCVPKFDTKIGLVLKIVLFLGSIKSLYYLWFCSNAIKGYFKIFQIKKGIITAWYKGVRIAIFDFTTLWLQGDFLTLPLSQRILLQNRFDLDVSKGIQIIINYLKLKYIVLWYAPTVWYEIMLRPTSIRDEFWQYCDIIFGRSEKNLNCSHYVHVS